MIRACLQLSATFPLASFSELGGPVPQEAIRACWQYSGDLKEVHFVLFGSDTLDVWLAKADKLLKPVADTTEESTSSHASPAGDEASPMDDTPDAKADKDEPSPMQGTAGASATEDESSPMQTATHKPPARDEPSAVQGTAASQQALEPRATDSTPAQSTGSVEQGQSVQTLTGVKEGEASEASQEALGAPEVLEAAPPANDADMPGHSGSQDASQKGKDSAAGADVGKFEASFNIINSSG